LRMMRGATGLKVRGAMRRPIAFCFSLLFAGCTENFVRQAPPATATHESAESHGTGPEIELPSLSASESSILVTPDKNIGRPTEVVGVLDFHTRAEAEDKGFDQLRARAASIGADAVIGAEFEHGEGGGPSHLSGLAVRYR
jgi:hypothetical protein